MKNILLLAAILTAGTAFAKGRFQNEDMKSQADIQSAAATITGNLTSGSACVAAPSSIAHLAAGFYAYDTTTPANVPAGTRITAIPGTCSAGQIQLSATAAGSGTGDTLTFGGQVSQLINDSKIYITGASINKRLDLAISQGLIGGGGGGNGANYLQDANGQSYPAGGFWVVASGTGSADAVNYTDGAQSIKVTASSQQSKLSQDVTPVTQLLGQNMQATMWVKTALTNVQVCARVGGVAAQCRPVSSANTWAPYTVAFAGPASGSIGVEVSMTGSGTGTFNAQMGYLGKATSIADLSQARLYGAISYTNAASCTWSSSSSSYADYSPNTNCVTPAATGDAAAPATKIPAVSLPKLPPGEYLFVATGQFFCSAGVTLCEWQFSDGTNSFGYVTAGGPGSASQLIGRITYSTQGAVTVSVQPRSTSNGTQINVQSSGQRFEILVYQYPTQNQTGYRPDATPANWAGYQQLTSGWSFNNSTVWDTSTAGSGITLTPTTTARNLTCSNFGTAPGITCNLPAAGNYEICANMYVNPNSGANFFPRIVDGSGNIIAAAAGMNSLSAAFSQSMCGQYTAAQAGSANFQIYARTNGNSSQIQNVESGNSPEGPALSWTVKQIDSPMGAPYLVNSVSTSSAGQERLQRATITNNGTVSAVASQSGNWITAATRTGTGAQTLTIAAGTFSAPPACTCTAQTSGVEQVCFIDTTVATPSNVLQTFSTADFTGNPRDSTFQVMCMGPR